MEVTLAVGIVAFAFIGVIGLLPAGMNVFHQAMNVTVGGQIVQRVLNDAQQTDFDQLIVDASGATIQNASVGGTKTVRYFDYQGSEIVPANLGALSASEKQKVLYWVNTRVVPATSEPSEGTAQSNTSVATVTVQVAENPAGVTLAYDTSGGSTSNLWNGASASSPAAPTRFPLTRSAYVARNQ